MNSRRIELGIKAIDLYYKDDNTEVNNVTTKEGEEKMVTMVVEALVKCFTRAGNIASAQYYQSLSVEFDLLTPLLCEFNSVEHCVWDCLGWWVGRVGADYHLQRHSQPH